MTYSDEQRWRIFEKTDGYCIYCGKKLAWKNYGNSDGKAGWEVDHSIPISRGGTDHLNNLVPSCIPCNRDKGDLTGSQYRALLDDESSKSQNDLLSTLLAIGVGFLFLGWINKIRKKQKSNSYYS